MEAPVKLFCAIAFALFPLAAPVIASAQSLDVSLLSALCSDDYYEDTAGRCSVIASGKVLTLEAILEKYGFIISRESDDEVVVCYFDDSEDMPVGSIQPQSASPTAEDATVTDDKSNAEPANEQETIASRVITVDPPSEISGADDVTMTGPTARRIPAAAEAVDDNRTIE
jgi:hypothetical protein